jgi:excisionase family DNA binding protein
MLVPVADSKSGRSSEALATSLSTRITVPEIARRLEIGRLAVYAMLEQGIVPGIRFGRRWIITRHAYEQWERNCGMPTGLQGRPERKVT